MDFDALVYPVVLERPDHLQASAIADVCQAGVPVAPEIALENAAVGSAVEQRAPGFQLTDASGCFLGVQFGHTPVVQILSTTHGIGEVNFPVVALVDIGERRSDSALRHYGVGFAQQRFADN